MLLECLCVGWLGEGCGPVLCLSAHPHSLTTLFYPSHAHSFVHTRLTLFSAYHSFSGLSAVLYEAALGSAQPAGGQGASGRPSLGAAGCAGSRVLYVVVCLNPMRRVHIGF